jgi:hypothetical protein
MAMTKDEVISKLNEILNGDEYQSKIDMFIKTYKDNKQYTKLSKLDLPTLKKRIDSRLKKKSKDKYGLYKLTFNELLEAKEILQNLISKKVDDEIKEKQMNIKSEQNEIDELKKMKNK